MFKFLEKHSKKEVEVDDVISLETFNDYSDFSNKCELLIIY